MPIFMWNEANVEHIGRHGVTPEEAEYVVANASPPFPRRHEDAKWLVWGETADGRPLQVIFIFQPNERVDVLSLDASERLDFQAGAKVIYVIHAMPMTSTMKRRSRRQRKRRK
jgi:uncharacterized DUF497 family protein